MFNPVGPVSVTTSATKSGLGELIQMVTFKWFTFVCPSGFSSCSFMCLLSIDSADALTGFNFNPARMSTEWCLGNILPGMVSAFFASNYYAGYSSASFVSFAASLVLCPSK